MGMGRHTLFWGLILIVVGALLLLNSLGILHVSVWGLIWPLFLIGLGSWILWGFLTGPHSIEAEEIASPLGDATKARVRIRHGAGRLSVDASAGPGELAAGTFGGGLDYRARGCRSNPELAQPHGRT